MNLLKILFVKPAVKHTKKFCGLKNKSEICSKLNILTMSGGNFAYQQYHITEIADSIECELKRQGKLKPKEELCNRREFYEDYPEEKYYYTYPKEVQAKMRQAVKALRIAAVYAQRVDWFLSGDDGEESFLKRLKEDLSKLSKK